jgi:uncharacterized membrane protein YgdD (TMEM256/DUF423 family)
MGAARFWATTGAVLAGLAVAAGAFGSHGLRHRLSPSDLATFETAVRYQMYHGLALFAVAWLHPRGGPAAATAGWAFLAGIALFCGSLYLLTLCNLRWMGAVTPFGGVAFLAGWAALAAAAWRGVLESG